MKLLVKLAVLFGLFSTTAAGTVDLQTFGEQSHSPLYTSNAGGSSQSCETFVLKRKERSQFSKIFSSILGTGNGRNIAVLGGVSKYTALRDNLIPAADDIQRLRDYLLTSDQFDDVIVLVEENFNIAQVRACLTGYLADLVSNNEGSRVLFLFTGHGFSEGQKGRESGYLLTPHSTSFRDRQNSVSLAELKSWLEPAIRDSFQLLILINSCHSGAFFSNFGAARVEAKKRGSHAITASSGAEKAFSEPGKPGSIFFNAFLEAVVDGRAPGSGDVVTVNELYTYIRERVISVHQAQNPRMGELKPGEPGGYFFAIKSRPMLQSQSSALDAELSEKETVRFGEMPAAEAVDIPPTIVSFLPKDESIVFGDSTVLSWEIKDAKNCAINNKVGEVSASGKVAVSPTETTNYELSCGEGDHRRVARTTVLVEKPPGPKILRYNVDSDFVDRGSYVTFTWDVENVDQCSISGGTRTFDGLPSKSSKKIRVYRDSDYELICSGARGEVTKVLSVEVDSSSTETSESSPTASDRQKYCCQPNGQKVCPMLIDLAPGSICTCSGLWGSGFVCM